VTIAPPRIECLDLARKAVLDRADSYGRPEDLFSTIAARWSLTLRNKLREPLAARDVALLMLDMKQERAIAGTSLDTACDISGYGACLYEIDAKRGVGAADGVIPTDEGPR